MSQILQDVILLATNLTVVSSVNDIVSLKKEIVCLLLATTLSLYCDRQPRRPG